MRRKKIFFIVLGFIAITAIIYGYQEYTRSVEDLLYVKEDYKIEAIEFLGKFEANEKDANEKYLDKIVAVKGAIKDIIKDDRGFYTVIIGVKENSSSVRCSVNPDHQDKADLLQMGNSVTIKGVCTGFNADELLGSDVILNRCVIAEIN